MKPASVTLAGLVPCAESGISTTDRGSPAAAWKARIISRPVISPWAPAAGWNVTLAMPVSSVRIPSVSHSMRSAPCTWDSGCQGWRLRKPASAAVSSLTLGLYFIVQDPSG